MKIPPRRTALLFLSIFLAGCEAMPTPAQPPRLESTPPPGQIQAFFTDPGDSAAADAIENALLDSINGANESIDMAMYNFSLGSIADGLIAAKERGVSVRVVLDSDALDRRAVQRMQANGIELVGDGRESLMHNKFLVIDGHEVWSGSLNLTGSGLENDNNNFVRFASPGLANLYEDEFDEMFDLGVFGGGAPLPAGTGEVDVNGAAVEVFFAPDDQPSARLEELVGQAQESIAFLAYSFTLNGLRDGLLEARDAGVSVRGVFDESQSGASGAEYQTLRKAGLDVRLDGIDGLMHDKVFILDGQVVVLGSYNFTRSADESNDENLLVIHDSGLARQYLAEFERIYAQGK